MSNMSNMGNMSNNVSDSYKFTSEHGFEKCVEQLKKDEENEEKDENLKIMFSENDEFQLTIKEYYSILEYAIANCISLLKKDAHHVEKSAFSKISEIFQLEFYQGKKPINCEIYHKYFNKCIEEIKKMQTRNISYKYEDKCIKDQYFEIIVNSASKLIQMYKIELNLWSFDVYSPKYRAFENLINDLKKIKNIVENIVY